MPYTVNDGLNVATPTNLVATINQMAGQIKRIIGGNSYLDKPDTNLKELGSNSIYKSAIIPSNPTLGMYWDELNNDGVLVSQWFWNGTYWISRAIIERGFPNGISGSVAGDLPAPIPIYNSSGMLVLSFSTIAQAGSSGSNNENNYIAYRLNQLLNNSLIESEIGRNASINMGASTRRLYSCPINQICLTSTIAGFNVTAISVGSPKDVTNRSSHSILFRLIR